MAGLAGGLVSARLLQVSRMTTMEGVRQPAMGLVAGAVHTTRMPLAWAAYLAFTVLVGTAFGWILRRHEVDGGRLVDRLEVIRNASLPWFATMLLNGGVLGGLYGLLSRRRPPRAGEATAAPRAA